MDNRLEGKIKNYKNSRRKHRSDRNQSESLQARRLQLYEILENNNNP